MANISPTQGSHNVGPYQSEDPAALKTGAFRASNGFSDQGSAAPGAFALIASDNLQFTSPDTVKISVDGLRYPEGFGYDSYSIAMSVQFLNNLNSLEQNIPFFHIGSNQMNRFMTLGLTKDRVLFVSVMTRKGKLETLFSQLKVKRGITYHVCFAVESTMSVSDLTFLVNGQVESQVSLAIPFEKPKGFFMFGSESPVSYFMGIIQEPMVFFYAIKPYEMKKLYQTTPNGANGSFYETLLQQNEMEHDMMNYSMRTKVPVSVVKSSHLEKSMIRAATPPRDQTQRYEESKDENPAALGETINSNDPRIRKKQSTYILREILYQNPILFDKCRNLAFDVDWLMTSMQIISPMVDSSFSRCNFDSLHLELFNAVSQFEETPVYPIETSKFIRVVNMTSTHLSLDEVQMLANAIKCTKRSEKYGEYIFYDKLLLAIVFATLSPEEIKSLVEMREKDKPKEKEKEPAGPELGYRNEIVKATDLDGQELTKTFFDDVEKRDLSRLYLIDILALHSKPHEQHGQLLTGYSVTYKPWNATEAVAPINRGTITETVTAVYDSKDGKIIEVQIAHDEKRIVGLRLVLEHEKKVEAGNLTNFTVKSVKLDKKETFVGFCGSVSATDGVLTSIGVVIQGRKDDLSKKKTQEEPQNIEEHDFEFPDPSGEWSAGAFQLVINHCANCHQHRTTTRHEEADFAVKFNEVAAALMEIFPNVDIVGNWDAPKIYGWFQVLVFGIGTPEEMDRDGRNYIYRSEEHNGAFPQISTLYNNLAFMMLRYGDTIQMGKAQKDYMANASLPPKWSQSHGFPANVPEREEKRKAERGLQTGMELQCTNHTCFKTFIYDENPLNRRNDCLHHPGEYQFGSIHGYWPESWTCCRRSWNAPGCRKGWHRGVPKDQYRRKCLNRGEVNPRTEHVDSWCGKAFLESEGGECNYHAGYFEYSRKTLSGTWTCCGGTNMSDPPCKTDSHRFTQWPDEEAKAYFIVKKVVNPGVNRDEPIADFKERAGFSGFFRKTVPYQEFENPDRKAMKKMLENEESERFCLNWACEKTFKDSVNKKKKTCKCHPGVWDFGHSGITVTEAMEQYFKNDLKDSHILWKPHWTCCRKDWKAKGCATTYHRGPLVAEMPPRKYAWPSELAQKFFKKRISQPWKEKLDAQFKIQPENFDDVYKIAARQLGAGGMISVSDLPKLCDRLNLHLLVISDDMSYHYKFMDVITHAADAQLDDGRGYIDKAKFTKWWYADLDTIRPDNN